MFTTEKPSFCQQTPFCKFLSPFSFLSLDTLCSLSRKKSPRPQLSNRSEPVAVGVIRLALTDEEPAESKEAVAEQSPRQTDWRASRKEDGRQL